MRFNSGAIIKPFIDTISSVPPPPASCPDGLNAELQSGDSVPQLRAG